MSIKKGLLVICTLLGLVGLASSVDRCCFSSNRQKSEGNMKLYSESKRIKSNAAIYALGWSPDGDRLAVLNIADLTVYDTSSWQVIAERPISNHLYLSNEITFLSQNMIAFGSDIFSSEKTDSEKNNIVVVDSTTLNSIPFFDTKKSSIPVYNPEFQDRMSLSLKYSTLVTLNSTGSSMYIYDLRDRKVTSFRAPMVPTGKKLIYRSDLIQESLTDAFTGVAVSEQPTDIALCGLSGSVYFFRDGVFDADNSIDDPRDVNRCDVVALSSDGKFLAVGKTEKLVESDNFSLGGTKTFLKILDRFNKSVVTRYVEHGPIKSLIFGVAGRDLFYLDAKQINIMRYSTQAGDWIKVQSLEIKSSGVALSALDRVASIQDNNVVIYDAR